MARDALVNQKELLQILKIGVKMKVKSIKATSGGIEVEFFEPRDAFSSNSKRSLSKKEREELDFIKMQAEIDELRLVNPLEYEERLAAGDLVD